LIGRGRYLESPSHILVADNLGYRVIRIRIFGRGHLIRQPGRFPEPLRRDDGRVSLMKNQPNIISDPVNLLFGYLAASLWLCGEAKSFCRSGFLAARRHGLRPFVGYFMATRSLQLAGREYT